MRKDETAFANSRNYCRFIWRGRIGGVYADQLRFCGHRFNLRQRMGQSFCDLQESDQPRVLWRQRLVFVQPRNSATKQAAPKQQDGNAVVGKVGEQEGRAGLLLRRQSGRLVELLHPRDFDFGSINTFSKLRSFADSLLRDTTWPGEGIRDSENTRKRRFKS